MSSQVPPPFSASSASASFFPFAPHFGEAFLGGPEAPPTRLAEVATAYQQRRNYTDEESKLSVIGAPFALCAAKDVFDAEFLASVRRELCKEAFECRENDLFRFWQARDLKHSRNPVLQQFCAAVYSPRMLAAVSSICGYALGEHMDLAGQQYHAHDRLLCHDDQLEGRRVAFICYLVDEAWTAQDGGSLDLFDRTFDGTNLVYQPADGPPAHSFYPAPNTVAFFTVGPASFHQVAENISSLLQPPSAATTAKTRISITGWFYDAPIDERREKTLQSAHWISDAYFVRMTQHQIAAHFAENSAVLLNDFLRADRYAEICDELEGLRAKRGAFSAVGPRNYQQFDALLVEGLTPAEAPTLHAFQRFLRSRNFAAFLLGLLSSSPSFEDLTHVAHRYVLCRLLHAGCFSLIDETRPEADGVDVDFFVQTTAHDAAWDADAWGGAVHYATASESLLQVPPHSNALSLVFKNSAASAPLFKFIKYVNALAGDRHFYMLSAHFDAK